MARNMARRRRVSEPDDYDPAEDGAEDEGTDEEPRRSSRRRRSAEPDDEPDEPRSRRSSRRRSRDEDEPDEDDAHRGRSRRGRSENADEPRRPSGRRGGRDRTSTPSSTAGAGWSGVRANKDAVGDFAPTLKTEPNEEMLVKILDEEPFYTYLEHWLDELPKRKSFVCLGRDNGCPLCAAGDRPKSYAMFNVVDLSDPDNPSVKAWKCGTQNSGVLEAYAKDKKSGPLNREDMYFSILRTGSKAKGWQTTIKPVKARDVEEDWDMDALTSDELDAFEEKCYEADQVITVSSKKQLEEIADLLD